jgi:hypothetical protein
VGTMERFFIGLVVVVFLIAVWALAVNVGTQISGGLQEWLQP